MMVLILSQVIRSYLVIYGVCHKMCMLCEKNQGVIKSQLCSMSKYHQKQQELITHLVLN